MPSSQKQDHEDAVSSPVHGYITHRGDRAPTQHQQQRPITSKLSLPGDGDWADNHTPIKSGLNWGFATDRSSPSAHLLRYGALSSITSKSVVEARSGLNEQAVANSTSNACGNLQDVQQQFSNDETSKTFVEAPDSSHAARTTPNRLHGVMSRANAALSESDALTREFVVSRSPSDFGAIHLNAAKEMKISASTSQGHVQCQTHRLPSLAGVSSDDIDSSSSRETQQFHSDLSLRSPHASVSSRVPEDDVSLRLSLDIPISVNTAPILLISRGSSNSSSASANDCNSEVRYDSAISDPCQLQPDCGANCGMTVARLQRQKLRSGIGAMRPTSAGGARKTVRPDLASGFGFKTVDVISRVSSDTVRVQHSSCFANCGLNAQRFRYRCLLARPPPCLLATRQLKKI